MEPIRGFNIYQTSLFPVKAMAYMEKHRMFEVIAKLILQVNSERPTNGRKYIAENIKKIANSVKYTKTFILAPPIFDIKEFSEVFEKKFNVPVIKYSKKRIKNDTEYVMKKLRKFLKKNGLENKHQIYLNFPNNCDELKYARENGIEPTRLIQIRHDFQIPFKTHEMYENEENSFVHEFEKIKSFYPEIHRIIDFGSKISYCGENVEQNKSQIVEIIYELLSIMRNVVPNASANILGKFNYRIVIFGRRGSGKKTQAIALANRFNLVYINVETLILQTLASSGVFGDILRETFEKSKRIQSEILISIIYKRILKKDCLSNGWILINFPHTKEDFEFLMKLVCPPNKIIFLHCRERVCLRRLIKRWENNHDPLCDCIKSDCCKTLCKKNRDRMGYIKQEIKFFNMNKNSILDYLSTKKETIHIDGNHSFSTVRNSIWSKIESIQIGLGIQRS